MQQATEADLRAYQQERESTAPEPMNLDRNQVYGSDPDPDTPSGPNLNPDGSISEGTQTPTPDFDDEGGRFSDGYPRWLVLTVFALLLLAIAAYGIQTGAI
jgi:hypothetical protein